VLKHRIAGAAFLLFFGALFLPWVLGAPDVPSNEPTTQESAEILSVGSSNDTSTQTMADELAAALASEELIAEEQVYISKITPLNAANQSQVQEDQASKDDTQITSSNPQTEQSPAEPATEELNSAAAAVPPPTRVAKIEPATTPSVPEPKIEVGWVVQVGVFTDANGAGRVVADLKSKGFEPSTTIVDTNRGKATGTRIWLGPYAQRVDAAKAKTELNQKTGEAGFIRAYP